MATLIVAQKIKIEPVKMISKKVKTGSDLSGQPIYVYIWVPVTQTQEKE